jgi:protein-L-isoaspartate O-methyltransferase
MLTYLCSNCKHYENDYKCKAFEKIPREIFLGFNDHNEPTEDQNNDITFTPLDDE